MDKEDEHQGDFTCCLWLLLHHSTVHVQSPKQRRPAKDRSACLRGKEQCPQQWAALTMFAFQPHSCSHNAFSYSEPLPANSVTLAALLLVGGRWDHQS